MFLICVQTYILFILFSFSQIVSSKSYNYDICKNNTHKIYLEIGDNGTLTAENLTTQNKILQECFIEIVTCPSCVILINFNYINLTDCNETKNDLNCCEYIQLFEFSYEKLSKRKICGNKENFGWKTLTKHLIVQFFYFSSNDLAFSASYKSVRNQINLSDKLGKAANNLISPYFPSLYSNDLASEYVINCVKVENCRVRLIFIDFQLSTDSLLEFLDYNGQRLDVVTGVHFRPPILVSSGPSMTVRFYANGGTGLGFKAEYFFEDNNHNNTELITDCGGYVDNLGSAITMMDMVKTGSKSFDCYWIIKPPKNYLHFKTYLYLKIVDFWDMQQTEIVVHESTTSTGKILEVLRETGSSKKEHVQPIETGFYVSLKGTFNSNSRLAIVYSAFSYKDCFSGADFLCENHRCIPRYLTCDGFDHCGDNSDEPISCFKDENPEPSHTWYSRTPNYFFPKIDQYSDLKTATFIFIMSSLGLMSLGSTFFILLYRINTRTRHDTELENHLQIITDLLEEDIILDTDSISDAPPLYEAPPDYEEVIKISLSDSRKSSKHKQRKKRSKSAKSRKNEIQQLPQNITSVDENKLKKHFRKNNPFFYFSDKAISSNVKLILRRKWHSHGDINIKKDFEPQKKICTQYIKTTKLSKREIASDSELLNIDSDDENNSFYNSVVNEKGLFDYFKKKNSCQCEGACACASMQKTRKFHRKISKKNHSKFYTR